jgi:hypothetical protein
VKRKETLARVDKDLWTSARMEATVESWPRPFLSSKRAKLRLYKGPSLVSNGRNVRTATSANAKVFSQIPRGGHRAKKREGNVEGGETPESHTADHAMPQVDGQLSLKQKQRAENIVVDAEKLT